MRERAAMLTQRGGVHLAKRPTLTPEYRSGRYRVKDAHLFSDEKKKKKIISPASVCAPPDARCAPRRADTTLRRFCSCPPVFDTTIRSAQAVACAPGYLRYTDIHLSPVPTHLFAC